MIKGLNLPAIKEALPRAGLSQESVADLRQELRKRRSVQTRINFVKQVADSKLILPLTIRRALEDFEGSIDLEPPNLGPERLFMAVMTKFAKSHDIVLEQIFGKNAALPKKYVRVCEDAFKTQFFKAAAKNQTGENWVMN